MYNPKNYDARVRVAFLRTVVDAPKALDELFKIVQDAYVDGYGDGMNDTVKELRKQLHE